MLSSLLLFKIGLNRMLLYMCNYNIYIILIHLKEVFVTIGYTRFKISNIFSSSTFKKYHSGWFQLGHELLHAQLSCPQYTREASLDFKSPKLTFQSWLQRDSQTDRGQGRGWSLLGYYCDFKSKRTEESFMRGNKVSSKQTAFLERLLELHIGEERDSRKKKRGGDFI